MRILLVVVFALWLGLVASAQNAGLGEQLDAQTEQITAAAGALTEVDPDLPELREKLLEARREAVRFQDRIEDARERVQGDLDRLGDFIEGEVDSVTQRRDELRTELDRLNAQLGQANLNMTEADRILAEIAALRRTSFYAGVFERGTSPLLPASLFGAAGAIATSFGSLEDGVTAWVAQQREDGTLTTRLLALGAALVFAILMAIPVRNWFQRQLSQRLARMEPLQSRRILVAAVKAFMRAVPALLAGFAVYQSVLLVGLLDVQYEPFLRGVWLSLVGVILVDGAMTGVFAPRAPIWRVISVSDRGALWIRGLAVAIAVIIFADFVLRGLILLTGPDSASDLVIRGVVAVVLGGLFIAITRSWAWTPKVDGQASVEAGEDEPTRAGPARWLMPFLGLLAGGGLILAASLGYAAAAHFFALRIAAVVAFIALGFAIRAMLREGVRLLDHRFRSSEQADQDGDRLVFFWIGVLIDLIVLAILVPAIFLLFGSDWSDVRAVVEDALFGFQIGSVRLSILQILTAIGLFALLLAITRFVQRTAETKIFPRTRMDIGVQNSLKTLIGYVGLVIAFMTGVGMLGFDLSNLAIIAGALSVGIGFGLQSIVNNFVSGLILLFERPIKVGDWIVTASGEGIVKRISVRSTEIETFDRSSIIVPNSELISSSVVNWTHKNKLGRVTVPVGVSYNEDPDKILEILRGIPKSVDIVLNYPEPLILFTGFGDSSLDFEIRAFVSDVSTSLKARTALRVAIFKAFREAGVEIPFPQRDLHVRSGLERLGAAKGGHSGEE